MDVGEVKSQDEAVEPSPTTVTTKVMSFLDLPAETQHQIVGHCSQSDLICLSLVSSHFRNLAAAQLYRHFHIVFPDDDDPAFDSPIDSLAGGLETFVTSEYDYAQHMRELLLDTLSVGNKAETAYKPYLFSLSCGKFMNTLLLLTLRKAKSLETFHWNIRVELSRQVYRALHQMTSLRHLHLRLQAGPSLFEVPPPLPYSPVPSTAHTAPTASYWHPAADSSLSSSSVSSGFPYGGNSNTASLPSPKALAPKNRRKTTIDIDPPTISGFKKLKTLSVLDIDSLELVTEIKACIRNSSLTLNKLKLSFSSRLATQARKPRARDLDVDDDDPDDDFQVVPLPPPSSSWDDAAPSVVAFRAQQERKAQEAVLGRIFDLEHYLVKQEPQALVPEKEKKDVPETATAAEPEHSGPGQLFMDRLKEVSDRLALETEDGLDLDSETKQEILASIYRAAKKYTDALDSATEPTAESATKTKPEATTQAQVETETDDAKKDTKTSFQTSDKVSSPEDIDIEAPVATEDIEEVVEQPAPPGEVAEKPTEQAVEKDQTPSPAVIRASLTLEVQKENFSKVVSQLQKLKDQATDLQNELVTMHDSGGLASDIANLEKKVAEYGLWIRSNQEELDIVRREIQDAARQAGVNNTEEEREYARICDYVKSTRGIPLRSFSVYLMPLKAATLRSAVDLQVLHKLTLLNVGSQTGIWAMLTRENRKSPLPLRKIFTDHASKVFLACVKQLQRVDELYMLERSESYKPESFAPKAATSMQDIRRAVLKKHLASLRRLVIKNDADNTWDADEKTVFLLCNRGARLEELAVSLNIRSMHTLMQNIPLLARLRALYIPHFRSNDTCPWVMRETRRFLIDAVSHHPQLKLEWLAIDDDSVVRILRSKADKEKRKEKKEKKNKDKAAAGAGGTNPIWMDAGYPAMQLQQKLADELLSDSDDDEVEPKLETIENIRFYDVWGVRMFKKEMMAGQL
ncbi:F-box domain-containing protein [Plectosphaerella plurivora]|uniref:F-box domain-containing protein n=1 Tax=Plectosphaerella plurivora TaxID=936078 RepID=A0A9P8VCK3_9PEZI|nr:F-box domain-containing protein [Plectosphaerella plurivora]